MLAATLRAAGKMSNIGFRKSRRGLNSLTMSAPDADPAKRPMLFPDPVIEFYMERVDRAATRAFEEDIHRAAGLVTGESRP